MIFPLSAFRFSLTALLAAAIALISIPAAHAHKPSDSYLTLRGGSAVLEAQWDIALRDLDHAIGLDGNADGAITWGELRARQAAIADYALTRFDAVADGVACASRPTAQLVDHHSDGAYAVLQFAVDCASAPRSLQLAYRLFFDFDPQHRGLVQIATGDAMRSLVFSADQAVQRIDLAGAGAWHTVRDFWRDGVWHIWAGFDHVLFLLALLMPAVLRRDGGVWRAVGLREAFSGTVKVVTAFTAAHSITLSLAALGIVVLPSRLVESAIAASVVLAALNNAFPIFRDGRWLIGCGFGLLHGFGFASVLADTGLPSASLSLALLGFNAGVETGQLAIVAAFLPLAYAVRRSWMYQRVTLVAASCAIALLASVWFVERALDLHLLPL